MWSVRILNRRCGAGAAVVLWAGLLAILLRGEVQPASAEAKSKEDAARAQSAEHLKRIGLALQNYNDTYARMPPHASYDKNGRPMLSWRVFLLPFIEEQKLFVQFHLNEPWDSEHNKKLLAKMPKIYASPGDKKTRKDHTTHFQGFFGKGAFFEGKRGIIYPRDIPDGTSNTFVVVEATKVVPWSKPEDLPYDAAKPLPKLGLPGAGGFQALMGDGSVYNCFHKISEATLRNLIRCNDGNPIGSDF